MASQGQLQLSEDCSLARLGQIGIFNIPFGPNKILDFCVLKRIDTPQKRGDWNRKTKQNKLKLIIQHDSPQKVK